MVTGLLVRFAGLASAPVWSLRKCLHPQREQLRYFWPCALQDCQSKCMRILACMHLL